MARKNERKLTDEQIKEVCRLYGEKIGSSKLGKLFGVNSTTIITCLGENNIGIIDRKPKINPGDKFGRWTVIKEVATRKGGRYFLCECSCEKKEIKEVRMASLRNGMSQSCGCLKLEMRIRKIQEGLISYNGETFGKLTVLHEYERDKHGLRQVMAQCSCDGNIRPYVLSRLKSGETSSCGCHSRETAIKNNTYYKKDYEEKYPFFCQIEEIRDCEYEPGIEVRCKKCDKWFKPTKNQISARINALERPDSKYFSVESNFYCSEECKQNCDVYYAQLTPKSLRNYKDKARCNQHINRKALLDLQIDECGYNYCEKCGKRFDAKDLALHHNIMVSLDPGMADDMSHQLLCCVEHHDHKDC